MSFRHLPTRVIDINGIHSKFKNIESLRMSEVLKKFTSLLAELWLLW